MNIRHIRHATHLLEYAGRRILVDPVLSPAGAMTPIPGVPNSQPNPLVPLPVPVEELLGCDTVAVTHLHRDHFDPEAMARLDKGLPILCAPAFSAALREHGFTDLREIGTSRTEWGIEWGVTGGTHGIGASAAELNPVYGFLLKAPAEPTVYITGDTVWCPEVEAVLRHHRPEVIIAYGGAAVYNGDTITMDLPDLARIRSACPEAELAVLHLEGWNHCGLTRESVRRWAAETEQEPMVWVPVEGECREYR